MSTITDYPATRPVPRKLGPATRLSANARNDYYRQIDYLAAEGALDVRTKDFLKDVLDVYSDRAGKDFYPSQSTMSEARQCSRRTIQRRIAAAKAAGVLLVAQLKGYDANAGAWFCSSNTHRITSTPEWAEKMKAKAKAVRDAKQKAKVDARATPKRANRREEGETRPPIPDVDVDELERCRDEAVPVSEVRSFTDRLRAVIVPPRPPPRVD